MVYFVLQPTRWINTVFSVQYKIVQNCPVKSVISHNASLSVCLCYFTGQDKQIIWHLFLVILPAEINKCKMK